MEQTLPHSPQKEPTLLTRCGLLVPATVRQYISLFIPLNAWYFVSTTPANYYSELFKFALEKN